MYFPARLPHRPASALLFLFLLLSTSCPLDVNAAGEPSFELFRGVIRPEAGLFNLVPDSEEGRAQHEAYLQALRARGLPVDLLEQAVRGSDQDPDADSRKAKLVRLALASAHLDLARIPMNLRADQEKYFQLNMQKLSARDLLRTILQRPTLHLRPTPQNTGFTATYELNPILDRDFPALRETRSSEGDAPVPESPQGGCGPVGSAAEWLYARDILMHTPGDELYWGVIHPDAALFERAFDTDKARAEHEAYMAMLEKQGIHVHRLDDALLQGTESGPTAPARRKKLLDLALESVQVEPSTDRNRKYVEDRVKKMSPRDLRWLVLHRPTVHLKDPGPGHHISGATYDLNPIMNLYFMRDQQITTARGIVIGKMNSEQRAPETKVIKLALENMGIKPVMEISGDGRLEGGDFIPAGDTAFIGQGLRTNAAAIQQMLNAKAFGSQRVVVVKDAWKNQEQMHLDTYFNVIDRDRAVLVQSRVEASHRKTGGEKFLKCDVYEMRDGRYEKVSTDLDFVDYLEKSRKMKVIGVPDEDQKRYGTNFLTTGPGTIMAVAGQSPVYEQRLKEAGVKVTWVPFPNLTGGYGAAHCMTQVFRRCPDAPMPAEERPAAPSSTPASEPVHRPADLDRL